MVSLPDDATGFGLKAPVAFFRLLPPDDLHYIAYSFGRKRASTKIPASPLITTSSPNCPQIRQKPHPKWAILPKFAPH